MDNEDPRAPEERHGDEAAETRTLSADHELIGGWITTEVAAAALRVSPRTVRDYIHAGELNAKAEGEGVQKRWLVSIDAVQTMRNRRQTSGELPHVRRGTSAQDSAAAADVVEAAELVATVQELQYRLGRAEARAELTERAESTLREERDRLLEERAQAQEEARRLREELEAERSKSFWRKLFGG